ARLARHGAVMLHRRRQHANELGIGGERGERHGEPARPVGIVGIEECDDVGARGREPEIACAARTEGALGRGDADARGGEARQIVARAVGRGVVDHDQLEARTILGEHAGEGARQAGRAVIGREDDGNVRQVGQSSEAPVEASPYHAGASAARATGFSTIGRLISAESTPNSTESHHTGSYEWVYSNAKLPRSTPRKPPTWWLKNAKPNSMASQRVPNITATR